MDLLDKGKHCNQEYCHQLDLLPIKCKACFNYYCADHFKYESHNCKLSEKFNYKIPTCNNCNQVIEFKRGKDLNICLNEHLKICKQNSNSNSNNNSNNKSKKCSYKNCKSKEIFTFKCDDCGLEFCTKHRIQEVHSCQMDHEKSSSSFNTNNKINLNIKENFSISVY